MRNLQACGKGICTSGLPAAIEIMQSRAMRHRRIRGVCGVERRAENCRNALKGKNSTEKKGENERKRKQVQSEKEKEQWRKKREIEKNKWMAEKCELQVATFPRMG